MATDRQTGLAAQTGDAIGNPSADAPRESKPPTATDKRRAARRTKSATKKKSAALPPDAREQLFNDGAVGPIQQIQLPAERIVKLRGILFDLDPASLRQTPLIPCLSQDPKAFYKQCLKGWQSNNSVLRHLEVRASGTGVHGILWLDPVVELLRDADRDRWCSIVKVVQATLPTDSCAPGITATTRAIGSTNSKSGRRVLRLAEGAAVSPESVTELAELMIAHPFKTLMGILVGDDRLSPCPVCDQADTTLTALDHVGMCYGCGKVTFKSLCNKLFTTGSPVRE